MRPRKRPGESSKSLLREAVAEQSKGQSEMHEKEGGSHGKKVFFVIINFKFEMREPPGVGRSAHFSFPLRPPLKA